MSCCRLLAAALLVSAFDILGSKLDTYGWQSDSTESESSNRNHSLEVTEMESAYGTSSQKNIQSAVQKTILALNTSYTNLTVDHSATTDFKNYSLLPTQIILTSKQILSRNISDISKEISMSNTSGLFSASVSTSHTGNNNGHIIATETGDIIAFLTLPSSATKSDSSSNPEAAETTTKISTPISEEFLFEQSPPIPTMTEVIFKSTPARSFHDASSITSIFTTHQPPFTPGITVTNEIPSENSMSTSHQESKLSSDTSTAKFSTDALVSTQGLDNKSESSVTAQAPPETTYDIYTISSKEETATGCSISSAHTDITTSLLSVTSETEYSTETTSHTTFSEVTSNLSAMTTINYDTTSLPSVYTTTLSEVTTNTQQQESSHESSTMQPTTIEASTDSFTLSYELKTTSELVSSTITSKATPEYSTITQEMTSESISSTPPSTSESTSEYTTHTSESASTTTSETINATITQETTSEFFTSTEMSTETATASSKYTQEQETSSYSSSKITLTESSTSAVTTEWLTEITANQSTTDLTDIYTSSSTSPADLTEASTVTISSTVKSSTKTPTDSSVISTTTVIITTTENSESVEYDMIISENGVSCIFATMDISLVIPYDTIENKSSSKILDIPKTARYTGSCSEVTSYITLAWNETHEDKLEAEDSLTMTVDKDESNKSYSVTKIDLKIYLDEVNFNDSICKGQVKHILDEGLEILKAPIGKSYVCSRDSIHKLPSGVEIGMKNVSFVGFNNDTELMIHEAVHCLDNSTSDHLMLIVVVVIGAVVLMLTSATFVITQNRKMGMYDLNEFP